MNSLARKICRIRPAAHIAASFLNLTGKGKKTREEFDRLLSVSFPINTYSLSEKDKNQLFHECMFYFFRYGSSVVDYFLYEFYRCSEREIETYMTEQRRRDLFHYADKKDYWHIFGNKKDFFEVFGKYMQKDCLFVSDATGETEFREFLNKNDRVVIKPVGGQRGIGVEIVEITDSLDVSALFEKCRKNDLFVERVINGCEELKAFHPQSLNTIRISTAVGKDGVPHIMAATLRTGTGDHDVDNGHSEGVYASIDTKTGIIQSIGYNAKGYRFPQHPDTGKLFAGTPIPYWQEVCRLTEEVAVLVPEMRYIGWDWALDENNNWILIEGNEPGGIDVHQHPTFTGLYKEYRDILHN